MYLVRSGAVGWADGETIYVMECDLEGQLSPSWVKKKWENHKQKYTKLKALPTGVSTEGGEAADTYWRWYAVMDKVLQGLPLHHPTGHHLLLSLPEGSRCGDGRRR
ncbi:hypothetical protein J4Q44_G00108720 [Coregonus suidteri]|uniref:Uncharacterized protein n=1 Tax=Coregonus suidteri TaxID=861788 RepID=A0AAN8M7X8_9TELE